MKTETLLDTQKQLFIWKYKNSYSLYGEMYMYMDKSSKYPIAGKKEVELDFYLFFGISLYYPPNRQYPHTTKKVPSLQQSSAF